MCMFAGHIGNELAARVLIEMQRYQEFVFGGFYSGIATCDGSQLYEELVGDMKLPYFEKN